MKKVNIHNPGIIPLVDAAITEDIGEGDHTSLACIPDNVQKTAYLIAREKGIIAGIEVARVVARQIDPGLTIDPVKCDGNTVNNGDLIFKINGNVQSILKSERLILNFMQRMSGVATLTQHFVEAVEGTNAKILDTRKTTPNFRIFEKMAVQTGGGTNHRMGLYDMIMIKDNHIDFCGGITKAIESVQQYLKDQNLKLNIIIEARSFDEIQEILTVGGVQRILLDNFIPEDLEIAVGLINKRFETEASGGINLQNVRQYAETGVDYISVGALTHSYTSLDMSLNADL